MDQNNRTCIMLNLLKTRYRRLYIPVFCFASLSNKIQSAALREAIREYEANKWKVIGQKVGKPAKVSGSRLFSPRSLSVRSNPRV